jgi:predicted outer membrane repeat protein
VRDFGAARLKRCVVEHNVGVSRGGAIYAATGFLIAVDTRFSDNKTLNLGGAFYAHAGEDPRFARFVNCTFTNHRARLGGVAYLHGEEDFSGGGSFLNCTLAGNVATEAGGAIYAVRNTRRRGQADVFNSILWGNFAPAQRSISGAGLDVRYSDVEGGYAGAGNLDVDPELLADLRPRAGSPVNDAGDNALLMTDMLDADADGNTAEPLPLDLVEHARRADDPAAPDTGAGGAPFVDMGAHEMDAGTRRPASAPGHGRAR